MGEGAQRSNQPHYPTPPLQRNPSSNPQLYVPKYFIDLLQHRRTNIFTLGLWWLSVRFYGNDCLVRLPLWSSFCSPFIKITVKALKNYLTSNTMTTELSAPFCVSETDHGRLLIYHCRAGHVALHLA